jgi:hypothetical protein
MSPTWDYKAKAYADAIIAIRSLWPRRDHGVERVVLRRAIAQARRCAGGAEGK